MRLCKALHKSIKKENGLLNLGGFQSSNFEAHIADVNISIITYIFLFLFRFEHYQSKGELFSFMNAECLSMTLWE